MEADESPPLPPESSPPASPGPQDAPDQHPVLPGFGTLKYRKITAMTKTLSIERTTQPRSPSRTTSPRLSPSPGSTVGCKRRIPSPTPPRPRSSQGFPKPDPVALPMEDSQIESQGHQHKGGERQPVLRVGGGKHGADRTEESRRFQPRCRFCSARPRSTTGTVVTLRPTASFALNRRLATMGSRLHRRARRTTRSVLRASGATSP